MANTKQKGLFHHSSQPDTVLVNFNNQINDVSRRLRILEERYTNIRRKGQVVEQNMLSENKKVNFLPVKYMFPFLSEKIKMIGFSPGKTLENFNT